MTIQQKLQRTRDSLITQGFTPCEDCKSMYRCAIRERKCENKS